jgi:uncharacterized protein (TIGR02757 family)
MNAKELKDFLEVKVEQYHQPNFLKDDPISIPHHFNRKEDIEISGFLTATISWGNRKSIIKSANRLMEIMEWEPYRYIMEYHPAQSEDLSGFVHRTFNAEDLACFFSALKHLYSVYGGLEPIFARYQTKSNLQPAITAFKRHFFEQEHLHRSTKHISDPEKGSAAKRINMFLRWMIRDNSGGVDFGLWPSLHPSQLSCPLDIHSGRVARKLGLLKRNQNDGKAVVELDINLRKLDPADPVKYDFALFGLGVFEKF